MNEAGLVDYIYNLDLPSCSMSFNEVVLEEEIPGYRTMSVTGRESLAAELAEYDNGYVDGSTLLNRKYPSRDIDVNYSLIASTTEDLRKAFNKLRGILYAQGSEEVQIVFKDEDDVFYLGTVSEITGDEFVNNASATGTIRIHCQLPYKWSIEEFEETADDDGIIVVDYDGTYPSFPVLHAKVNNETLGYIGFVNDRKNIIQLGDPDELDVDLKDESTTLFNDDFVANPEKLVEYWTVVNELIPENRSPISRDKQVESLAAKVSSVDNTNIGDGVTRNFNLTDIISTSSNARWSGASRVRRLSTTPANFVCTMNYVIDDIKANVANSRYHGEIRFHLAGTVDGTKRNIASLHMFIATDTKNQVQLNWNVLDTQYGSAAYTPPAQTTANLSALNGEDLTPAQRRSQFSKLAKSVSITKSGDTFIFDTPAGKKTVKLSGSEDYTISEVGFWILGTAKVTALSASVKSAEEQFIDGLKTEGVATIRSNALPSSVVTPSSSKPIEIVVYGQKKTISRVSGKIFNTKTTTKKKIKIVKPDINYETGLLNTVVHYNSSNRRINLLSRSRQSGGKTIVDADGYNWYIRGTYYYTGPNPDRKFIDSLGVRSVKLVKNEYDAYSEIPNPFTKGDEVDVNCNTGEIVLNGLQNYNLGALGNDWEEFCLYPGGNAINCSYSDWAQEEGVEPEFSLTYRKVYI